MDTFKFSDDIFRVLIILDSFVCPIHNSDILTKVDLDFNVQSRSAIYIVIVVLEFAGL